MGSGVGFSFKSTTFARMVVVARLPLLVDMFMVISQGSDGVCHFTHTS